ncbi:MAG: hypothetical protein IPN61_14370 [Bacteroidetes bacterium]|nr:hypothetical protein [Bacteroidota bacterium]
MRFYLIREMAANILSNCSTVLRKIIDLNKWIIQEAEADDEKLRQG